MSKRDAHRLTDVGTKKRLNRVPNNFQRISRIEKNSSDQRFENIGQRFWRIVRGPLIEILFHPIERTRKSIEKRIYSTQIVVHRSILREKIFVTGVRRDQAEQRRRIVKHLLMKTQGNGDVGETTVVRQITSNVRHPA